MPTPSSTSARVVLNSMVLGCFVVTAAQCTSLSFPNQVAAPGQVVVVPLSFASQGQAVSSIQFDLDSDSALSVRMLPGGQIGGSAKVLYTGSLPGGVARFLIVGMNQAAIQDGELVRAVISVDPSAAPGTAQVRIRNAVAADPDGNAVLVPALAATIQVQPGSVGGAPVTPFAAAGLVNAASLLPGPVCPGEIVTIFGGVALAQASAVQFSGVPSPILYAGPGQVNAIVPFGLDPGANATLEVRTPRGSLGTVSLPAATVSPALFTMTTTGSGPVAALNEDASVNSYANPASAGSTIMLFGTGFGPLLSLPVDGQSVPGPVLTALPVTAAVAGIPATVTYAGAAPGLVAGVMQINVQLPAGIPAGPAIPVSLTAGGVSIPAGVTVSIR